MAKREEIVNGESVEVTDYSDPDLGGTEDSGDFDAAPRDDASPVLPDDYAPISLQFLPADTTPELGDNRMTREGFARWVTDRVKQGVSGRRDMGMDWRVLGWRDQYEGVTTPKSEPWEGASNLFIPMTRTIVNAVHANINKALTGIAPFFEPDNTDPSLIDDAQIKGEAMQEILENVVDWRKLVRQGIKSALIDRSAIFKVFWDRKVAKVRKWEQITPELRAELATIGQAKQLKSSPDGAFAAICREEITFDGARVELIDVLDYVMYPADAPTLDDALLMGNRYWASRSKLNSGVKSGTYDGEAVERVVANASGSSGRRSEETVGDRARYDEAGIASDNEIVASDRPYECFQCLVRYDYDNDGIDELCLVDIELHTGELLRAELYPYFHDRPFYVPLVPYERAGFFYGYSLCEILEMQQAELNAFHNLRVDRAVLENSAPVIARPGMKRDLEKNKLRPGLVLFDDTPRDALMQMQFGNGAMPTGEMEAAVRQTMMEVSAANETVLAQPTKGDTTNGEIERTLQSTNTVFDVLIDSARGNLDEVPNQIADLYAQYQTDDRTFGVAGDMGEVNWKTITPAQMRSSVGFRSHGTSALQNPVLQAQLAEKLVMFSQQSPFIQSDLRYAYQVAEHFLKYGLGVRNPEEYIGPPSRAADMQKAREDAPPPPPETKISRSERADEVQTLAAGLKSGELTPEEYLAATDLAVQSRVKLLAVPTPPGAILTGANDNMAGFNLPPAAPAPPTPEPAGEPGTGPATPPDARAPGVLTHKTTHEVKLSPAPTPASGNGSSSTGAGG